ncbi:MAG: TIGR02584 family CRISPR-associated protein [Reyranella sp.]|uniref:CRISPR-associated ring nuclease Csm6 n=1 Tax=Reyranella sp. TaxID=1929291 RepID=UPI0011F70E27|nr:CRISPR-associated ring nuclease Csm6 [Reyranella sp.]TAJ42772.1 MAG: TIGR02584 family CRISPR-associated protein [Reyranella sp.]
MSRKPRNGAKPRNVLIVTAGLAPAVVTETVWALLQPREQPRFVPDEIVICTTARAAPLFKRELCREHGRLDELCKDLGVPPLSAICRVEPLPGADDIRSAEDATLFADAMTRLVRDYTSEPSTRIHMSIAGGRKTMSFHAGVAMCMFGRIGDEISHVLVRPAELEQCDGFFWPTSYPSKATHRHTKAVYSGRYPDAQVDLNMMPYIRTRSHTPASLLTSGASSYSDYVAELNALAEGGVLRLDLEQRTITYAGLKPLHLNAQHFALYWVMAVWAKKQVAGASAGDQVGVDHHGWLIKKALDDPETYRKRYKWPINPRELYNEIYLGATGADSDNRKVDFAQARTRLIDELQNWVTTPELADRLGAPQDRFLRTRSMGLKVTPDQIVLVPEIYGRPRARDEVLRANRLASDGR